MIRLASGSPRRHQLLGLLGVPFTVVPADVDERAAAHPAVAKVAAVARRGEITLAADTLIELDGERIGKPADPDEAIATLHRLAGREHVVRTEVALVAASGRLLQFSVASTATGEPLDRAGSYAIQGGAAALVARYDGCYSNIVGLPLCHVYFALRKVGLGVPERPEPAFTREFGFTCPAWRLAYAQGRWLRGGAAYDTKQHRGERP